MQELTDMPCWFLGANAPKGFFSKFDQLFFAASEGKCILIKGGPGTGKSTMLKKFAEELGKKNIKTELIFCSADADSLDAVISDDGKFVALDATLPHAFEPKFPGAYEKTLSLYDCWDEDVIFQNRKKIIALFEKNHRLYEEARRYISAAASLLEEASRLAGDSLDSEKVIKTALRICAREIGRKKRRIGTEKQRFLSAVTEKGVFFLNKTPKILCDKIYFIDDDSGAVSKIFMAAIKKYALEQGEDIITCRCPIFPSEKIEHVFIPSLRLGFMTVNKRHKIEVAPYRIIHSRRFFDQKSFALNKIKIKFALKSAKKLIEEASLCMKEAKIAHDELESFYISAMDFSKAEEKLKKILDEI